jgi:seryl-tRNA synthetase
MEIRELKARFQEILERIPKNQQEISEVEDRIVKAEEKFQQLDGLIGDLRRKRQKILAVSGDAKNVNASIAKAKDEYELLEDEIIGLKARLGDLTTERERLAKEELITKRNILAEEVVRPLVRKYNTIAKQLAGILTELEEAVFQAALLRVDGEPEHIVFSSSRHYAWDGGIGAIPSMFMRGEANTGDIYDRRNLTERLRANYFAARDARSAAKKENITTEEKESN